MCEGRNTESNLKITVGKDAKDKMSFVDSTFCDFGMS